MLFRREVSEDISRERTFTGKMPNDALNDLFNMMRKLVDEIKDLEINLMSGEDVPGEWSISKEIVDSVLGYLINRIGILTNNGK